MGVRPGGKGLGKDGAKRHRKALSYNIQGTTKPAICHLRISGFIYEETPECSRCSWRTKTVTAVDVVYALKRQGRTI
uniref:Histone H4 n=1 Tax=Propithecus coquereli TaxID=379532 RepID=A0A2K6G4X1_PROCO